MTTQTEPSLRAIRAVMAWYGDDVSDLASGLGVKRTTLQARISRGLRPQDIRQIADHYDVDPMELAMGRVPRLPGPTRE